MALLGSIAAIVALYFFGGGDSSLDPPRPNPFPLIFSRILDGRSAQQGITVLAIVTTAIVVLSALAVAFAIGLVVGGMRLLPNPIPRFLGALYVETIRGIPIFVMLLFVYFGVRTALKDIVPLSPFASAVLALGVCYGAYMAEIVRAGLLSIPQEEMEAASLEATRFQVLRYVVVPQALRTILPALANECIALLKDSSIIGVVTLVDITRAAQIHASSSFRLFETFSALALVYLVLSLILSRVQRTLEKVYGSEAKALR